jgi:hypothetical protein
MQAPESTADQTALRAALTQARAAADFAARAKAEADAAVEKLERLCEARGMVDACATAAAELKAPRAPSRAARKLTLYEEVEALTRAIRVGDARAIADARPEVILAQNKDRISALFVILACSTRCEAKVRIAMLNAWRTALDRAGCNASTIAEYINKPNDYGMVEVFALTYACMHTIIPVEAVEWLVSHGADVNAQNKESGLTALIALADKTSSRRDDNKDTLRVLAALQAAPGGLRLDLQTIDARTALDEAVASGKTHLETRLRELMGLL